MATIGDILNVVDCNGTTNILGTGTKGNNFSFKRIRSLWLTPKGFKYDSTKDLDLEYIQELQATEKLIILNNAIDVEDESSDDKITTESDNSSSIGDLGLYQFKAIFKKGEYFNSALSYLRNSIGTYDVVEVDIDNNILGTRAADGSLKGFSTNMINPVKVDFVNTEGALSKQGLQVQLANRMERDRNYYFIDHCNLEEGFYPNTIDGVNEVVLSFEGVPSDGDALVSVKAVLKQDGTHVTGIVQNQFEFIINGSVINSVNGLSGVNESNEIYNFNLGLGSEVNVNDVLEITLKDSDNNNRPGIVLDQDVFKSNTAKTIVVL